MTEVLETPEDLAHELRAIQAFCNRYNRFHEKIGGSWEPDFLIYAECPKQNPDAQPTALVEVKGIRGTLSKDHNHSSFIVAVRKLMTVDSFRKKRPHHPWKEMALIIIWAFEDVLCWAEWGKLEAQFKWIERTKKRESGKTGKNDKEYCLTYDKSVNRGHLVHHWIPMD
jgi:hypothetical protein